MSEVTTSVDTTSVDTAHRFPLPGKVPHVVVRPLNIHEAYVSRSFAVAASDFAKALRTSCEGPQYEIQECWSYEEHDPRYQIWILPAQAGGAYGFIDLRYRRPFSVPRWVSGRENPEIIEFVELGCSCPVPELPAESEANDLLRLFPLSSNKHDPDDHTLRLDVRVDSETRFVSVGGHVSYELTDIGKATGIIEMLTQLVPILLEH